MEIIKLTSAGGHTGVGMPMTLYFPRPVRGIGKLVLKPLGRQEPSQMFKYFNL